MHDVGEAPRMVDPTLEVGIGSLEPRHIPRQDSVVDLCSRAQEVREERPCAGGDDAFGKKLCVLGAECEAGFIQPPIRWRRKRWMPIRLDPFVYLIPVACPVEIPACSEAIERSEVLLQ